MPEVRYGEMTKVHQVSDPLNHIGPYWTILDHIGPKDSKFDRGESDANGLGSTQVPRLQEGLLC